MKTFKILKINIKFIFENENFKYSEDNFIRLI